MRTRRLVLPEVTLGLGALELDADAAQYLRDVLRLGPGAPLLVSDGRGAAADAEVVEVSRRRVVVRIERVTALAEEAPLRLALLQAVGKGDKMDAVVRQATELGVSAIVPVLTARAVARQEARVDRWRRVAIEAIRVSGRVFLPALDPVTPLAEVLSRPRSPLALCFAASAEHSLGVALEALPTAPPAVEVLVGPEGGLTAEEIAAAEQAGFQAVRLGPHTLRTETAGPAVVALLMYWARGLGW